MVRDTKNIITTFNMGKSVTATAIKGEENLHLFLPLLQEKCAIFVSPIIVKKLTN